jgi:hypothetical protein
MLALLMIETLSVFPNYISFFNLPSGGARGGLKLLSDSNLDWGQDLDGLARFYRDWRAANPGRLFYLCYFGSADPRAYGIDYINAAPGTSLDRQPPVPLDQLRGGVLAISATALQGSYAFEQRPALAVLREIEPLETINDTIYIYPLPDR